MRHHKKCIVASILVSAAFGAEARATWPNHAINLPVRVAPGSQSFPTVASDGSGGAFIVWYDGLGLRGTRVHGDGSFAWDSSVVICSGCPGGLPRAVTDTSGGIYITAEYQNHVGAMDTYIHRLTANGAVPWSVMESGALDAKIVADGTGGALLVWENYQSISGSGVNVWAQRFSESGSLWRVNVTGEDPYTYELEPSVASDGQGGAFVAWEFSDQVKVQKLGPLGNKLWPADGVLLGSGRYPQIVAAPAGGAMVAWVNGGSTWVRRVLSTGVPIGLGPIEVTPPMGAYVVPASDGGMILVGKTAGPLYGRIVAQRIQPDGQIIWEPEGVEIVVAESPNLTYHAAPDGSGGVIVTYSDGVGAFNVFGQRLSADGEELWGEEGVVVSSAGGDQKNPAAMSASGFDYAIVAWDDTRNDGGDIYAQRVDGTPSVSRDVVEEDFTMLSLGPNPFDGQFDIQLSSARAGILRGALFDVRGRRVAESTWKISRGASVSRWNLREVAAPLEPGVYFVRLSTADWRRDFRVVHIR